MTGLIVCAAVLIYLVGFWVTYRRQYRAAVDEVFKKRLNCSSCESDIKDYKLGYSDSEVVCWTHSWSNAAEGIWILPLLCAMFWPVIGLVLGTRLAVTKSFFPRGVVTPAKTEWELAVSEARIERNAAILKNQIKQLDRSK